MSTRMPVLFVGHGSPMNAVEDNEFSHEWRRLGKDLPRPSAILSISAHWYSNKTMVTAMEIPRTIHDFSGFPKELFAVEYPAPGSKVLSDRVRCLITTARVVADTQWGLDHGTWSVLRRMYPHADVPVVQLSLDGSKPAAFHFKIGAELKRLREEGVLILGSGNIAHNLSEATWKSDLAYPWAEEFDRAVKEHILDRDFEPLVEYESLGEKARRSIPTNEHYLPMLYVLAASEEDENIGFFNEKVTLGSVGMRGFVIGGGTDSI